MENLIDRIDITFENEVVHVSTLEMFNEIKSMLIDKGLEKLLATDNTFEFTKKTKMNYLQFYFRSFWLGSKSSFQYEITYDQFISKLNKL